MRFVIIHSGLSTEIVRPYTRYFQPRFESGAGSSGDPAPMATYSENDAMTGEQFDTLVKLMRGDPKSASNRAARLVLVEGMSQADAMRAAGADRTAVSNTVKRYAKADETMRQLYSGK